MSSNKPGEMHPSDIRNLIIFVVLSVAIWAIFDTFILDPQKDALRQSQQQTQMAQIEAERTADPALQKDLKLDRSQVLQQAGARLSFDNGELSGSLSTKGARLDDVTLDNYFKTLAKQEKVEMFSPAGSKFPYYAESGWIRGANATFAVPDKDTQWTVVQNGDFSENNPVILQWNNGAGLTFKKTISLDKHALFTIKDEVVNQSGQDVTLFPYSAIARRGTPERFDNRAIAHDGLVGYVNGDLNELDYDDLEGAPAKSFTSSKGWAGFSQKYWLSAMLPEQANDKTFRFLATNERLKNIRPLYQSDITGTATTIASGQSATETMHFYVGAKKLDLLGAYESKYNVDHFDLAIDFGILYFLTRPFHFLLTTFYDFTGNFGVAIILLTVLLRLAVFPLANTSYRSFAKLKKVAPEMKALREKYGDDKGQMQKELVKLYQKENVNPMAGCLPILLQIPIFFAMYKVIYITLEMRHAPFFGWIQDLSAPDPTSIFNLFGLIPIDLPSFLTIGAWPIIMMVFMIIQQKLNPPPQDPMQKTMMKYFPFFITFILSGFAAGLVVYWAFSNALSVLQQAFIMKSMGVPIHLFDKSKDEEELEEAIEHGPAVHPRAQMIKEDVEEALFGDDDNLPPKDKK